MKYNNQLYPFKSKWINIENHAIHYVDEGNGQIILFSHAPLGSSFMYRRFIQKLSKYYRCIAIDFPGFGLSTNQSNETYSINSQSEIIAQFISKLNLTDIIALGHDTGGPSIFKVATEQPHLFRGLIPTDTIIFPTVEYPKIHRMLNVVGSRLFQFINNRTNLLVKLTFNKGVVTRTLRKEEKQQYYDLFKTKEQRNRITQLLYSLRKSEKLMSEVLTGFENQLNSKPTLLIYGEDDPVTKLGIPERIHNMQNNSELYLIKKEGHFPHEGQAERMIEIIYQWINNLK